MRAARITPSAIPTRLARARPTPVRARRSRRSTPRMEGRWVRRSGSQRRSRPTPRASPANGRGGFRVDVEDRSQPGATMGQPPPDRYRRRTWLVDPDTSDGLTRRQAVACAAPTAETITAPTPDIADGGNLFRGNQQIHPP